MKRLNEFFLLADFFGKNYNFEHHGTSSYKTVIGGILSILMLITVSVIGFLFGKEIYVRQSPIASTAENIADPIDTRINISSIPFIVTFHNYDGSALQNLERVLEFESMQFLFNQNYNITHFQYSGFVECVSEDFGVNKDYVNTTVKILKQQGFTPKCLNPNNQLFFQNDYSAANSAFLHYQFKICNTNRNESNCLPPKELNTVTTQIYIALRYLDSYLDPKNYTSPITYYENIINQQVGNQFLKRNFLRFTKNILVSDIGWIFESDEAISYISLKSLKTDINPTYDGYIYWITMESPRVIFRSTRSYMKIQELIAKIGGLFNGISLSIYILLFYYVKLNYYVHLLNQVNKKANVISLGSSKLNISDLIQKEIKNNHVNEIKNEVKKDKTCKPNRIITNAQFINKVSIWNSYALSNNENPNSAFDRESVSIIKEAINKIIPCFFKENKTKIIKLKRYMNDWLPLDKYLLLVLSSTKVNT